jgi:type VI secretion system protein ImpF
MDRLIDADPRSSVEAPLTRAEAVRRLRIAVRRDLEWLLNSRRIAVPPDAALQEVNRSAYAYGLPDLSTVGLANPAEQNRLLAAIEKALRIFEPRLTNVKVLLVSDGAKKYVQRLDFRIEGLLLMDPAPELVSFDTTLDGVSQSYRVKSDGAD